MWLLFDVLMADNDNIEANAIGSISILKKHNVRD